MHRAHHPRQRRVPALSVRVGDVNPTDAIARRKGEGSRGVKSAGRRATLLLLSLFAAGTLAWLVSRPTRAGEPHRALDRSQSTPHTPPLPPAGTPRPPLAASAGERDAIVEEHAEPEAAQPAPQRLAMDVQGVLVHADGHAPPALPVFLLQAGSPTILRSESTSQGQFRFDVPEAGEWILRIGSSRTSWVEDRVVEVARGTRVLEPIELPPLGSVQVTVMDADRTPVPDIEVRIGGTRGEQPSRRTDALGRSRLHLPAGTYRFYASESRFGRGNKAVDLSASSALDVVLELRRGPVTTASLTGG